MDDSTTGVTERTEVKQSGAKIWTLFFGGFDTRCRLPYYPFTCRGVAQPGRALGSGPRGRRFESSRPDHKFLAKRQWEPLKTGGSFSFVSGADLGRDLLRQRPAASARARTVSTSSLPVRAQRMSLMNMVGVPEIPCITLW